MSKIQNIGFNQLGATLLTVAVLAFPAMAAAQGGVLEEIVVTASKRSTTLQDIPIAVSVTTADTIEKAQILDLKDLQSVVPSLKINQLQNSTNTNFIIRGFGNGANNPGIEPSVGVFIDGVYRSRSASSISDLPSLERVEVLRGPQSTLFGKNASAGVISVVTRKPTGESAGRVSATIGDQGYLVLKGEKEGALSENVAYQVYASANTRDGYIKNAVTGTELNDRDRQAVRGQLVITPSDVTEIRIIADYDQIDEVCCAVSNFFQSPTEVFVNQFTGARVVPNDPFSDTVLYDTDPRNEIENAGISMQIDRSYDTFDLTSITSFRTTDSFSIIDADFTSANYITNPITTEIDTFTQEIRLTSTQGEAVDWMIGGYYFDEEIFYENDLPYGPDFRPFVDGLVTGLTGQPNLLAGLEQSFGLPFGSFYPANGAVTEEATLDNQAASLFGTVDWHLSDRMTATIGLNYTKDEKEATLEQVNQDFFASLDFVAIGGGLITQGLIAAGVPPAIAVAQGSALATNPQFNPLLGFQAVQFLPNTQPYPNPVEDGKTDDDELTYSLRLAFDINDDLSIYGGISTGFKASSWNLSRDAKPVASDITRLRALGIANANLLPGTRFASPEEATSIEFGIKAKFDRGSLNVAIFEQEIEGFQSNIFGGTGFNLANAEKQSTKGVEFDLLYYPTDALKLSLAGTFLDPVYDSFTGAQGPNGPVDLSGATPSGIHETSISVGATYSFTMGNNEAYISGDYQYDDEVPTNDNIPASVSSEEFKNLNISAGLTTPNGLGFALWGRNITDHETVTTAFPTVGGTGGIFGYRNAPRTYGVTVSKDF